MKRFHCVPSQTTFGQLTVNDVYQYIGGSAEFVKKAERHAIREHHRGHCFVELLDTEVLRVGDYRNQPERPDAPLPCSTSPDADAPGEPRAERPPQEEVRIRPKEIDHYNQGQNAVFARIYGQSVLPPTKSSPEETP